MSRLEKHFGRPLACIEFDCASLKRPGIYLWTIEDRGRYIGKYTNGSRPLREYSNNVYRALSGLPYHIKGQSYRRVHRALALAFVRHEQISLSIVKNCEPAMLRQCEDALIGEKGCLNGSKANCRQLCECGRNNGGVCSEVPPDRLWPHNERHISFGGIGQ